jgi:LysR family cyn operon transcriptional activator
MVELRHLRYFIALAGSLNFTRAAERVHVTQSTLSHQIRQLEDEVGQRLFERIGKRVVMTPAGESFLAYAARALKEVDMGLGELKRDTASMIGEVRIGTTHTFNLEFIPDCVARFLRGSPSVKIVVEELPADAIASQLDAGKLDFGVAYRPESFSALQFEPWFNEELVLLVGHQHPLAARRRIRMIELHREPLVLLPPSFSTRRLLNECFAAAGAEPAVIAEMNSVAAMLGLVGRMQVATIAVAASTTLHPALRVIPLENPTPMRTPGLLFNSALPQSRASRAFAALLRRRAMARGAGVARRETAREDPEAESAADAPRRSARRRAS